MKRFFFFLIMIFPAVLTAQELQSRVQIISPSLQTSAADKLLFEQLQQQLTEFMNNTRWTTENFKDEEKIDCNILMNISEMPSAEDFGGTIQITSSRPVFNTNYKTTLFNYIDDNFKFKYQRGTPLIFSIDQHRNNLTSILAFYAYFIIALDYDSFSLEGGTRYFTKAQQVVNNAQSAAEPGWKASENDLNRYWLVDNALQGVFKPLRQAFYKYHRTGFDRIYDNVAEGRKDVIASLELIQGVAKQRPANINVRLFFAAKVDEIINLFSEAPAEEKLKVYNLCRSMDAGNLTKYQKLTQGK
ncbi:MAG TPA: DUF4835 domain-containing protein [Flavobacteriales bacterium]|nr:DUF4835 domain-containing protein [Flavobacteriales bacterium]HRE75249.1 DUF4835 family protein [Flavobacteriales bacterium]